MSRFVFITSFMVFYFIVICSGSQLQSSGHGFNMPDYRAKLNRPIPHLKIHTGGNSFFSSFSSLPAPKPKKGPEKSPPPETAEQWGELVRAVRQSEMALKTHAANQEEPIHSQTSPAPKAVRIFAGSWDKPDGADEGRVPTSTVFILTMLMAAVSGLGAVPFFFLDGTDTKYAGPANALACGVMLAASFDLLHEAQPYGGLETILGMAAGAAFIKASQEFLHQHQDLSFANISGADARKTMLIMGIMTIHAIGEGSGVGVSFSGNRGWRQGLIVTAAIGAHNIPEGMAVATVLVGKGASPARAVWWSVVTSLPQPLVAVPSYVFVDTFQALLPLAMGFAAGCMIWMVFAELLPDALEETPATAVASYATASAAGLELFRMTLAEIEAGDPNRALGHERVHVLTMVAALLPLCSSLGSIWATHKLSTLSASAGAGVVRVAMLRGAAGGGAMAVCALHLLAQVVRRGAGDCATPIALVVLGGACARGLAVYFKNHPSRRMSEREEDAVPSASELHKELSSMDSSTDQELGMKWKPLQAQAWVCLPAACLAKMAFSLHFVASGLQLAGAAIYKPEASASYTVLPALMENVPLAAVLSLAVYRTAGSEAATSRSRHLLEAGAVVILQQAMVLLAFMHSHVGAWATNVTLVNGVTSFSAGMLSVLAMMLLQEARDVSSQMGVLSASLGAVVVLFVWLSTLLMCWLTPYCVDLHTIIGDITSEGVEETTTASH